MSFQDFWRRTWGQLKHPEKLQKKIMKTKLKWYFLLTLAKTAVKYYFYLNFFIMNCTMHARIKSYLMTKLYYMFLFPKGTIDHMI